MTIDKFYNETFDFHLELIVFDYSDKKDFDKVKKHITQKGVDESVSYNYITNHQAFCGNFGNRNFIAFDKSCFKDKPTDAIAILAHECGHVRGNVLTEIVERVTTTDSEVYLRISDWAFKKCLNSKYFKKMFK